MDYDIRQDVEEINQRLKKDGITFEGKTILVTGDAGFLGSWVCDVLVEQNAYCICLDNLTLGQPKNVINLMDRDNSRFINHDISSILRSNTLGTLNSLESQNSIMLYFFIQVHLRFMEILLKKP
ncbi:MAG: NAD-dependent epimerase/dehydratase family protein, partial [Candidatus Thorarchaeota archaeon]